MSSALSRASCQPWPQRSPSRRGRHGVLHRQQRRAGASHRADLLGLAHLEGPVRWEPPAEEPRSRPGDKGPSPPCLRLRVQTGPRDCPPARWRSTLPAICRRGCRQLAGDAADRRRGGLLQRVAGPEPERHPFAAAPSGLCRVVARRFAAAATVVAHPSLVDSQGAGRSVERRRPPTAWRHGGAPGPMGTGAPLSVVQACSSRRRRTTSRTPPAIRSVTPTPRGATMSAPVLARSSGPSAGSPLAGGGEGTGTWM